MFFGKKGVTLTFGDVAENYAGMEKIGIMADHGFLEDDIWRLANIFSDKSEVYDLAGLISDWHYPRHRPLLLIVRDPYPDLKDELFNIMSRDTETLDDNGFLNGVCWDKQKFQFQKVVNSHARYNLCFSDLGSNLKRHSDIQNKKGTIYNIQAIPQLMELHNRISTLANCNLNCEGNYYYDLDKTYIKFHSDRERSKVIGYRLGDSFPLHFRYHNDTPAISEHVTFSLNHGDFYMMTDDARGKKIKGTNILLKHAAGTNPIIFK